jgi:IS30 family transposase
VSTPEQNGVVERKNKHILEVTRCLLFAMNVPKYLWGEAVQTATYLINRMPLRTMDFSTPLEMLTDITSFKVSPKKFGCVFCS